MKKYIISSACLLFISVAAQASQADAYIKNGNIYTHQGDFNIAFGGMYGSDVYKGQKNNAMPILSAGYHGDDFNIDAGNVNYRFWGNDDDKITMAVFGTLANLGYDHNTAASLNGMSKRHISADLGFSTDAKLWGGTLSGKYQHDVTGVYNGGNASETYFHPISIGSASFVPYIGVSYLSAEYVDYYYGVRKGEATTSRSAFKGKSDFTYSVGYKFIIPVTSYMDITQSTGYSRLGSRISDSPIVDSANQWATTAMVAFHF
ncbi:MipA/OmpV family protein [Vibrio sp. S11_S32]|uniref:MipA/OmpV family protein n=1 Tax=Vibrio sp. S11_S32 TaxID=2720225 RepID=UPI0016818B9B|nr:MipA/OmpV family protein [Vibrio sp. S11_S32]MBD1577561.1 MipA/OmpV family protein [Vibrio sp. S11_S32]